MNEIFKTIDEFIITLKRYNPKIFDRFNNQINENTIYSQLINYYDSDFILQFSKYFSKICNGINVIYDNRTPAEVFYIFPTYFLNSSDKIDNILKVDNFYNFTHNKFLPLFSSGHGEYLGFYTEEFKKSELDTKVYLCSTSNFEIDNYCEIYQSINIMLKTHIIGYQKGIYFIDEESCLDFDFDEYWELHKKMNPKVNYWKR